MQKTSLINLYTDVSGLTRHHQLPFNKESLLGFLKRVADIGAFTGSSVYIDSNLSAPIYSYPMDAIVWPTKDGKWKSELDRNHKEQ